MAPDDLTAVNLHDPDEGLSARILPAAGMLITSLAADGHELLGQRRGVEAYLRDGKTMGIPLLYPWANRLGAEVFEAGGVTVDLRGDRPGLRRDPSGLPIHGLLAAHPGWTVARQDARSLSAAFDLAAWPQLLASWPFPHRLTYDVELGGGALELTLRVTATGEVPVPLAFGLHPYLVIPGIERTAWRVELPAREHLDLDERGLPTGASTPQPAWAGTLGDLVFDDAYDRLADGAEFVVSAGGWELRSTFTGGYRAGQVFAPPSDPVICFEPMAAPTNALVTGHELALVAPGETRACGLRIAVRRPARARPA